MMISNLLSLLPAIAKFQNFHYYLLDSFGWVKNDYTLRLRNGMTLHVRPKKGMSVADIDIIREVVLLDEYHLEHIRQGAIVVDIGAQIGSFALLAAKSAQTVYAFEPVPHNYTQLQKNLAANEFDNIKTFNCAVTATDGNATIFLSDENEGAHSIYDERGNASIEVASMSLKRIVAQIGRINLLKMDCEGAEYPIILHTPGEYFERIDRILMELHYTPQIGRQFSNQAVIERLTQYGFSVNVEKEVFYADEGWFWIVSAVRE